MKNLLMIATLSLATIALMQPCFAQQTPAAEPVVSSYDELRETQQQEIMGTWNVVDLPRHPVSSYDALREAQQKEIIGTWNVVDTPRHPLNSYDTLQQTQQNKIESEWNALEVVRATSAPEGAPKDYLDQNVEQINMNAAIKTAIEAGNEF